MTSRTDRINTNTDLAIIRKVLDHADAHGRASAARTFDFHYRTVERWQIKRSKISPHWPSKRDITTWRKYQRENGPDMQRKSARAADYRKRVYLNRGPVQVDPTGTTRRLQALSALGWTQSNIAAELGVSSARVGHLMTGMWGKLHPSTAQAVRDVYDRLSMTRPEDAVPDQRGVTRVHDHTRREAVRRGYAPPLAWDDADIDNPAATPYMIEREHRRGRDLDEVVVLRILSGEKIPSTPDEKTEVCRIWVSQGRHLSDLERIHGWKPERYYKPAAQAVAS